MASICRGEQEVERTKATTRTSAGGGRVRVRLDSAAESESRPLPWDCASKSVECRAGSRQPSAQGCSVKESGIVLAHSPHRHAPTQNHGHRHLCSPHLDQPGIRVARPQRRKARRQRDRTGVERRRHRPRARVQRTQVSPYVHPTSTSTSQLPTTGDDGVERGRRASARAHEVARCGRDGASEGGDRIGSLLERAAAL